MFVCPECGAAQPAQGRCEADGAALAAIGDDVLLGTTIGVYRVARLLGVGGMGRVYKGVHPTIGSRVAIKVLSRECSDRPDLVERFFSEARAVNLIRDENIVNILDLATLPDGRPFIIMEFLDGAPLSRVLELAVLRSQPLPLGGLARLAAAVLDALGAAHAKGVVHRDLKPDNVYVTPAGRAKVLDFGIAKLSDAPLGSATRTGSLLGTPHYMSPEQAAGRSVDHRTDIYAMGVILFECATGQKPFHADSLFDLLRKHIEVPPPSPRALREDLPVQLEQVILMALAKAPEARFASAQAMSAALQHATQQLPQPQWATITGSTDAIATSPQAWAPSVPASWSSSRPPHVQPSPAPHPTTVSGSSGQLAPVIAAPARAARGMGVWLGLGALLLVGGGVAGVLATQSSSPSSPASPVTPATPPSEEASAPPPQPPAIEKALDVLDTQLAGLEDLPRAAKLKKLRALEGPAGKDVRKDVGAAVENAVEHPIAEAPDPTSPAAARAWPTPHDLAFAIDPKRVDVAKLIAFAVARAKQEVPDAELFRIDADGVGPDGFANLELPSVASSHGSISLRFRSPSRSKRDPSLPPGAKQAWKCELRIEAFPRGVQLRPLDGWDCSTEKPVPAPRCTPAELWKKAVARKAPTDSVAMLGYRSNGSLGVWYFHIGFGADNVFNDRFADDCR